MKSVRYETLKINNQPISTLYKSGRLIQCYMQISDIVKYKQIWSCLCKLMTHIYGPYFVMQSRDLI